MAETQQTPQPSVLTRFFEKATFLNKSFALYLGALGTVITGLLALWKQFDLFNHLGVWGIAIFGAVILVPFLLVFLSDTLPKILEKRHERSLQFGGL